MGFDYKAFTQYESDFAAMKNSFDSWINSFMLRQGMKFMAAVKPLTPVDTGDLRDHWTIEGVVRSGDSFQVWFVNPMEYATFVEYGHAKPYMSGKASPGSDDWVDGRFMMTVALEVVNRELPAEFDAEFAKFLSSMGVV